MTLHQYRTTVTAYRAYLLSGERLSFSSVVPTNKIPVIISCSDGLSGIHKIRYAFTTSPSGPIENWIDVEITTSVPPQGDPGEKTYNNGININGTDGNAYYMIVQVVDWAGNYSEAVSSVIPILLDTSAPVIDLSVTGYTSKWSVYFTSGINQLTAAATASDPHTGATVQYALKKEGEAQPQTWYANWEAAKAGIQPIDGEQYRVMAKATNGVGLFTETSGAPFVYDATAPANLNIVLDGSHEYAAGEGVRITATAEENHSGIASYRLAIGRESGGRQISALIAGNEDGWLAKITSDEQTSFAFSLPDCASNTYTVTLETTNNAGLTSTAHGILIVGNKSEKVIVWDSGPFQTDTVTLSGRWEYRGSNDISGYQYRIIGPDGPMTDWNDTTYTDAQEANLALGNGLTYRFEARAIFTTGGATLSGTSNGVTIDSTAPAFAAANGLVTPAATTSDKLSVTWKADDTESGIAGIEVLLEKHIEENTIPVSNGWIRLAASTEGNAAAIRTDKDGNPLLINTGDRLYMTMRVTNGAGLSVERSTPVIIIDNSPPPIPRVADQGDVINIAQKPKADWIWTTDDPESGTLSFEWAATRSAEDLTGAQWFNDDGTRCADTNTVSGFTLWPPAQGETWYFAVKATNGAGLQSIGISDGITFDGTAPFVADVRLQQGIAVGDVNYASGKEDLKLIVTAYEDVAASGINSYNAVIGSRNETGGFLPDPFNTAYESDNQVINLTNPVPQVTDGVITIFRAECLNDAGLKEYGYSKGTIFDTGKPVITHVNGVYADYKLYFDWDTDNSATPVAFYTLSLEKQGATTALWEAQTDKQSCSINLAELNFEGGVYSLTVQAKNKAGVYSDNKESIPIVADMSPPVMNQAGFTYKRYVCNTLGFSARATEDSFSGIAEYQYRLGTIENPGALSGGWVSIVTTAQLIDATIGFEGLPGGAASVPDKSHIVLQMRAKNRSLLWSNPLTSELILVDKTLPELQSVTAAGYTRFADRIEGIGIDSRDYESGLTGYQIALTADKTPGSLLSCDWKIRSITTGTPLFGEVSLSGIEMSGLLLQHASGYYIVVKTQNGAGEWSEPKYSGLLICDTSPPRLHFPNNNTEIVVNDVPYQVPYTVVEDASAIVDIDFTLTNTTTGVPEYFDLDYLAPGGYSFNFTNEQYGNYTLSYNITDDAGNYASGTEAQAIRVNAPPEIALPQFTTTPGKPLELYAYVYDPDGDEPLSYEWDLYTDGAHISAAEKPVVRYIHIDPHNTSTIYTITLTVTDAAGKKTQAATNVEVRNTEAGPLYENEYWSGVNYVRGDILIPAGITLTLMPGTEVIVSGDPLYGYDQRITVQGKLIAEAGSNFHIEDGITDLWNGIYVDNEAMLTGVTIEDATRGMTITSNANVTIEDCTFTNNRTGAHIVGNTTIQINNSHFTGNSRYGVKEDAGGKPKLTGCTFSDNFYDYYSEEDTIITIEELNARAGNSGNGRE